MIAVAAVVGYLVGSVPTAQALGRIWGVDLMREGSQNPGTTNALRLSGTPLAASVLVVEVAKGAAAVLVGHAIAGEWGAVAAGIGAVAGNTFNVWLRWKGGKGLGISLGVLLSLWPLVVPFVVVVIALAAYLSRSSGLAAVLTLVTLVLAAIVWVAVGWETGGLATAEGTVVAAVGLGTLMGPKHWRTHKVRQSAHL